MEPPAAWAHRRAGLYARRQGAIKPRPSPGLVPVHGRNERACRLGRNDCTSGARISFRNATSGTRRRAIARARMALAMSASSTAYCESRTSCWSSCIRRRITALRLVSAAACNESPRGPRLDERTNRWCAGSSDCFEEICAHRILPPAPELPTRRAVWFAARSAGRGVEGGDLHAKMGANTHSPRP